MNLLGNCLTFNPETNTIVFQLAFVDEDSDVESLLDGKLHNISISPPSKKQLLDYKHLKKWFADITEIIKHEKRRNGQPETITNKEKQVLSYELKKRLFPAKYINIGDTRYVLPPPSFENKDVTAEEICNAIIRLEEIYTELGVIFKQRFIREEKGEM